MRKLVFQITMLLFCSSVHAAAITDLLTDPVAIELLEKKCIRFGTSEVLPVEFSTACYVLRQTHLFESVQEEFIKSISQTGTVDFPVIETSPNNYYYINETGKRSDITELYRKQTDAHSFDYIVKASGKRFFGGFDVIIHLQIVDANPAGIIYSVSTHVYPRNLVTRFSAQKLGPVKEYFRRKVKLISYVAREIAMGLCEQQVFKEKLMREAPSSERPPTATTSIISQPVYFPAQ